MKKILVPLDASEHSKRALNQAKELAEAFGSQAICCQCADFHLLV